jgi:LDH2 family malate/lactate/ureidoglycolate dehydrogenase/mannose-6-phosphate isomerase-like protein (cupin superfamily)
MTDTPLVLRYAEIEPFDRGTGVRTVPYVGKWNAAGNTVTTGITEFPAGAGIPLHTHNVEEAVFILEGEATAVIGEESFDLGPGDATWAPAGVPHRFANRGNGPMRIYWAYGGREVTRTICATGVTVEHLSDEDRGADVTGPSPSAAITGVTAVNRERAETARVDPQRLTDFAAAVLAAVGVPERDARLVADSLVTADLWGHQSHGVMRLGWYVNRIRAGVMRAVTAPETVTDTGPAAVVDGHDGVGQVLAAFAGREAVRRARAHGVGAVAVRNSNHFGTAAYYTRMAARDGCVAILTTNASPAMAPWGGRRRSVGTNPWSIAAPAGRHGVMVLDIANTAAARGKVYLAKLRGETVPTGWAIDANGVPTTDPQAAIAGTILPMAGHKGYAIALMMDVLSGVLTGSAFGAAVSGPYQVEHRSGCGHLFIALEVAAFGDPEGFAQRMEELVAEVKAVPPAPGVDEVFFPGEIEARAARDNLDRGLALPRQTLEDLRELARSTGVPPL